MSLCWRLEQLTDSTRLILKSFVTSDMTVEVVNWHQKSIIILCSLLLINKYPVSSKNVIEQKLCCKEMKISWFFFLKIRLWFVQKYSRNIPRDKKSIRFQNQLVRFLLQWGSPRWHVKADQRSARERLKGPRIPDLPITLLWEYDWKSFLEEVLCSHACPGNGSVRFNGQSLLVSKEAVGIYSLKCLTYDNLINKPQGALIFLLFKQHKYAVLILICK